MMNFTAAGDAIIQRRIQEGYIGFSELTPFINQGEARFFNLETTLNYEGECVKLYQRDNKMTKYYPLPADIVYNESIQKVTDAINYCSI